MVHYFAEKTWVDLEQLIQQEAVVILPVGTTEDRKSVV